MALSAWGMSATLSGEPVDRPVPRITRLPPIGDYVRPSDATRKVEDEHDQLFQVRTPEPVQPLELLDEPESLEGAIATALAIDPWLDAHRLRSSAATEDHRAATAEAYPWVDVGASYAVRDNEPGFVFNQPDLLPGGATFPFAQREGIGYFAAVNVPIYTGGGVPAAIDAASSRSAARELEYAVARRDLKLQVAAEYIAVLRAQCEWAAARTTEESLAAHVRDTEMLHKHEQRPKNDVLAAKVALADARHAVISAQRQLASAAAALNRRLGRPLAVPVRVQDLPLLTIGEVDLEALAIEAVERREELARLAAEAQSLSRQADSILARNRPQAAVTGGYTFNENRYQSPEGLTSVGVGVTWNAFDAGRDRHKACALRQQAAALHRLRADEESRVRLQVHDAWLQVDETRKRLAATHEALAQAEENVRVARQRYGHDMGTNTDVLAAESLRLRSFRNHHHAYYDAVFATLRLDRALAR